MEHVHVFIVQVPRLIFVGKVRSLPKRGSPERYLLCKALSLLTSIRLGWKGFVGEARSLPKRGSPERCSPWLMYLLKYIKIRLARLARTNALA